MGGEESYDKSELSQGIGVSTTRIFIEEKCCRGLSDFSSANDDVEFDLLVSISRSHE